VLAERGALVVLNDFERIGPAEEMARQFGAGRALAVRADATVSSELDRMISEATGAFGKVDILVNNVGGSLGTPRFLEQVSDEDWRRVIELTLTSQFYAARAVAPGMKARAWGRIVNVSSTAGVYGDPAIWSPAYAAAKAGVCGLTRQLAIELGPHGITVNAVAPGGTVTEHLREIWATDWPESAEERERRWRTTIPVQRAARPDEIAHVIAFLASEHASFVNGTTVDINGGERMR
jgi:3-oxoacyl-[acyl-carrier protein] reductase